MSIRRAFSLICVSALASIPLQGEQRARIAVASNFRATLETLANAFHETEPDQSITLSSGSTGKLYAQIKAGAPFDAFFSADSERPALLDTTANARESRRFTYAIGRLALWTQRDDLDLSNGAEALRSPKAMRIAIANPKLAPYGIASMEFLEGVHLLDTVQTRLVFGENISQSFHFVKSKAADIGFVSFSQIKSSKLSSTKFWLVPANTHAAIEQQAILLTENPCAVAFLAFCRSDAAYNIILEAGYDLP